MAGQRVSPGSVHGRTTRIAEELVVSENTIRTHMRRLYAKLNVHKKQEPLDLPESVKANEIQAVRPVDADGEGGRWMRPGRCGRRIRTMDAARRMHPEGFLGAGLSWLAGFTS